MPELAPFLCRAVSCSECVCVRVVRIVCDMEESLMASPPGGPVELCIGDCSADYRTQSSQTYAFVVRTANTSCLCVCLLH